MTDGNDHTRRPLKELKIESRIFCSGQINSLLSSVKDVSIGVGSYREVLSGAAKKAESEGNTAFADTLQVLYIIVDMSLKPSDPVQPFQPMSWVGNARSPIPDDFTNQQVADLADMLEFLTDSRLVARISDVAWVRLKRIKDAHKAIDSYLDAVIDPGMMEIERYWCLERAFRLSKQVSSSEHWGKCEQIFTAFRDDQELFDRLDIDLLTLAKDLCIIDVGTIAKDAWNQGCKALEQSPHSAEQLFSLAAAMYSRLGDKEQATQCHRKAAERFLEIASATDPLTSISFLENAIEALKRAGAPKSEVQEVNKVLILRGQQATAQMKRIEGPKVDFSNQVEAAKEFVKGLPPLEALKKIALQFPILSYQEHRISVEGSIRTHPLRHLIAAKHFSDRGRQYSRRPSFLTDDEEEQRLAMNTEIWSSMAMHHQVLTKFSLLPALSVMHWTTKDLVRLGNEISYRPIVPPDRAEIFYVGIEAGLRGDFCQSAHILIPQLENSLRFLLEANGFSVTQIGGDLLHNEMPLNLLFKSYRKELGELFGSSDLVYTIESFLCCKSGENFRNEMAHGLIPGPNDPRFAFAWWLTVYLLFLMKFPEMSD